MNSIAQRYLELLKKSLLDELYIENEARFQYVIHSVVTQSPIEEDVIRNITRRRPDLVGALSAARAEGRASSRWSLRMPDGQAQTFDLRNVSEFHHTMIGRKRLNNIHALLDRIIADRIPGDIIETGVWRGGATIFMRGYLAAYGILDRRVWVADSFAGLPVPSVAQDQGCDFSAGVVPILAISREEVEELFRRYDLLDERVRFLVGWFKDTLPSAPIDQLALIRLDGDLYESTMDGLNHLYAKLAPGGFVIADDYGDFEPCKTAVDEFRARHDITEPITPIDWTGVFWRKSL